MTRLGEIRPRVDRGAAAVEFALILPVLIMLLLGVATSGLSYTRAIGLTNAVREGSRFGAIADATNSATWGSDVIKRVRDTQFDDSTSETAVCVQLWQTPGASIPGGEIAGSCSQGTVTPDLTRPTTATADPPVPDGLPAGACVVRVIGARNFTINIALVPAWKRVNVSASVARYERSDKVATCAKF